MSSPTPTAVPFTGILRPCSRATRSACVRRSHAAESRAWTGSIGPRLRHRCVHRGRDRLVGSSLHSPGGREGPPSSGSRPQSSACSSSARASGLVLLAVGARPAEGLHLLYAIVAIALIPLARSFLGPGERPRRRGPASRGIRRPRRGRVPALHDWLMVLAAAQDVRRPSGRRRRARSCRLPVEDRRGRLSRPRRRVSGRGEDRGSEGGTAAGRRRERPAGPSEEAMMADRQSGQPGQPAKPRCMPGL